MDDLVVIQGRADPAAENDDFFLGEFLEELQGGIDPFHMLVPADHIDKGLLGGPAFR
jgi:hypothetical protein